MRSPIAGMLAALIVAVAFASPAAAHERRGVGEYQFVAGWGTEPAYAGFLNSVQLTIADHDGDPVTNVPAGALKVRVSTGGESVEHPLSPNFVVGRFGTPGDYRAFLVPTRPGTYTFHFTGKIGDQSIDMRFTSSETTFDDLQDPDAIQFPDKDPAGRLLAERMDRELPRLERTLAGRIDDAESGGKLFGMIGIGVGALALIIALVAPGRKRA